jgi:hypothetical protein
VLFVIVDRSYALRNDSRNFRSAEKQQQKQARHFDAFLLPLRRRCQQYDGIETPTTL